MTERLAPEIVLPAAGWMLTAGTFRLPTATEGTNSMAAGPPAKREETLEARVSTVETDVRNLRDSVEGLTIELRSTGERLWQGMEKLSTRVAGSGQMNWPLLVSGLGVLAAWSTVLVGGLVGYVGLRIEPVAVRQQAQQELEELRQELTIYQARFGRWDSRPTLPAPAAAQE